MPLSQDIHELVSSEKVTSSINDGTISDRSMGTIRMADGGQAAEFSGMNTRVAEITIAMFPHGFHQLSHDGVLQIISHTMLQIIMIHSMS